MRGESVSGRHLRSDGRLLSAHPGLLTRHDPRERLMAIIRGASPGSVLRIWSKIHREGLGTILRRRLDWYRYLICINNRPVGRLVEILGNRVRIEGLVFSVDSPSIETS